MDYDTFYTVFWRGQYIHAKHNRTLKREEFTVLGKMFLSLKSAKAYATRQTNLKRTND